MTIRLPFVRHRRALSDVRVPYDSRVLRFRPDPRPLPAALLNPALTDRPSHSQRDADRPRLSPLPVSPSLPDLSDVSGVMSERLRPVRLLLPRLDLDREHRCVTSQEVDQVSRWQVFVMQIAFAGGICESASSV